jgi:uncharacterized protein with HEPN domain
MDDKKYLELIFQLVQEIEDICFTILPGDFDTKPMQDFIIRNVEIIGETTKHLSDEFKKSHPEIPWNYLAGMRDRFLQDPLILESGPDSEWDKLYDYLFDLKNVCFMVLRKDEYLKMLSHYNDLIV